MNDVLRIARLKIALQRAFLRRAILRVIHVFCQGNMEIKFAAVICFLNKLYKHQSEVVENKHYMPNKVNIQIDQNRIKSNLLLASFGLHETIKKICSNHLSKSCQFLLLWAKKGNKKNLKIFRYQDRNLDRQCLPSLLDTVSNE